MASTLLGTAQIPSPSIWCPKYSTEGMRKQQLSILSLKPCFSNLFSTAAKFRRCSSPLLPVINMSSM